MLSVENIFHIQSVHMRFTYAFVSLKKFESHDTSRSNKHFEKTIRRILYIKSLVSKIYFIIIKLYTHKQY